MAILAAMRVSGSVAAPRDQGSGPPVHPYTAAGRTLLRPTDGGGCARRVAGKRPLDQRSRSTPTARPMVRPDHGQGQRVMTLYGRVACPLTCVLLNVRMIGQEGH